MKRVNVLNIMKVILTLLTIVIIGCAEKPKERKSHIPNQYSREPIGKMNFSLSDNTQYSASIHVTPGKIEKPQVDQVILQSSLDKAKLLGVNPIPIVKDRFDNIMAVGSDTVFHAGLSRLDPSNRMFGKTIKVVAKVRIEYGSIPISFDEKQEYNLILHKNDMICNVGSIPINYKNLTFQKGEYAIYFDELKKQDGTVQ